MTLKTLWCHLKIWMMNFMESQHLSAHFKYHHQWEKPRNWKVRVRKKSIPISLKCIPNKMPLIKRGRPRREYKKLSLFNTKNPISRIKSIPFKNLWEWLEIIKNYLLWKKPRMFVIINAPILCLRKRSRKYRRWRVSPMAHSNLQNV